MRCPAMFTADGIQRDDVVKLVDGKWVQARPSSHGNIFVRIELAFKVFIGKYDALKWYKQ